MAIFNTRDRARQAEGEAKNAEREAAQIAEAAKVAAANAERARRQHEEAQREQAKEVKRTERQLESEVGALVDDCKGLLAERPEMYAPCVPKDLRAAARAALHGPRAVVSTIVGPVGDSGDVVFGDPSAGMLNGMAGRCDQVAAHVGEQLGDDHALAAKIDKIEVEIWRAFVKRLQYLAGESS